MEQMEQQGLTNKKIPTEYTPLVFDESLPEYTKDFQYGATIQQLRPGIEVEQSGGKYYSGLTLRTTGAGAGSQVITGVGFKPKMVKIFAYKGTGYAVGDGTSTSTGSNCWYAYESAGTLFQGAFTNAIYVNDGANASYANMTSFDVDGFTLSWALVGVSINFRYECYG